MATQPLFIAISNPKGGVGKSTFTIILASYFHYLKGKSVRVVYCYYPQYSLRVRASGEAIVNRIDEL